MRGLELGVLYVKLPDSIKKEIINPYISIKDNEARITLRILDSKEDLRRNELIKKINYDLKNELGLKENEFKLAGVLILFNNLLQSLFKSQILTLGIVMAGITLMFLILFRNITLSLIGVVQTSWRISNSRYNRIIRYPIRYDDNHYSRYNHWYSC